jgi:hypothetical protein
MQPVKQARPPNWEPGRAGPLRPPERVTATGDPPSLAPGAPAGSPLHRGLQPPTSGGPGPSRMDAPAVERQVLQLSARWRYDPGAAVATLRSLGAEHGMEPVLRALLRGRAIELLMELTPSLPPGGHGCLTLVRVASGDSFLVERHAGIAQGEGLYLWANGDAFLGRWVDGERRGPCVMRWVTGDSHMGGFSAGNFNGWGVRTYANGSVYEGYWRDGQRCGLGTLTLPNGDTYVGEWQGDRRHGRGTLYRYECRRDGGTGQPRRISSRYDGEWRRDARHGPGVLEVYQRPSGHAFREPKLARRLSGDFRHDGPHGMGVETYACGSEYRGPFAAGSYDGRGVQGRCHDRLEAGWSHGIVSDIGLYVYANGQRALWDPEDNTLSPLKVPVYAPSDTASPVTATVEAFVQAEDWAGMVAWRDAHLGELRQASASAPLLTPVIAWQADPSHVAMLQDVLDKVPTSPATRNSLRIMTHLLGPARPYAVQPLEGQALRVQVYGNDACLGDFIARTMPITGPFVLDLDLGLEDGLRYLFHQEHYANPRVVFRKVLEQLLDGLALAWNSDRARQDDTFPACAEVLGHWLDRGPCLDGTVSTMVTTLLDLGLMTDVARQIPDAPGATSLQSRGEQHLRVFRLRQLDRFASDSGSTAPDTVAIEQDADFQARYFNADLFAEYLKEQGMAAAEIRVVLAYQHEAIGVL